MLTTFDCKKFPQGFDFLARMALYQAFIDMLAC